MRALFNGDGWGGERGRTGTGDFLEGEEEIVRAERPEQLAQVLARLDAVASSGDPDLIAVGFFSYEAGVFLEGSTALARPHDFLPFAEFSVFNLKTARRSAPPPPAATSPFTFKEPSTAERSLSSGEWTRGVGAIRDGIARADVYPVNLSRRTGFAARVEPFALARALYADNPVPSPWRSLRLAGPWCRTRRSCFSTWTSRRGARSRSRSRARSRGALPTPRTPAGAVSFWPPRRMRPRT